MSRVWHPRCSHCSEPIHCNYRHDYMLTDEVWYAVHPEGARGFLHDYCLMQRAEAAGVTLTPKSFTRCYCAVNLAVSEGVPEWAAKDLSASGLSHLFYRGTA